MTTQTWFLTTYCPAIIVAALGMRAFFVRKNAAWADYRDAANVLGWFVGPMIVVLAPLLASQRGYDHLSAGLAGAGAILCFYLASGLFGPEMNRGFVIRARELIAGSAMGLVYAAYLVYTGLSRGMLFMSPSASLFINMLWLSFIGQQVAQGMMRRDYKHSVLGPGELMDRIREITRRRGVELQQVIIIKSMPGRARVINAAAIEGTHVAVFSDLIDNLTRAEVDAVLEHEIGHIADERIWTLDKALRYGAYLALLAAMTLAERHIRTLHAPWQNLIYVAWAGMFIVPELLARWYSRKAERRANENVGYMADPMSVLSGFYKLAVLNHHPLSRPWWSRIVSTHPCADEEINAIAKREGLTADQVQAAFTKAEDEIRTGSGDRYRTSIAEKQYADEADAQSSTELVPRPGFWAGFVVAAASLTAGVAFLCTSLFLMIVTSGYPFGWLMIPAGLIGTGLLIAVPMEIAKNRRMWRMRQQIAANLSIKYGDDTADKSLLVDAMLPDWTDWQGALLNVANGELAILGEAASLRIPLTGQVNVSRWADSNSAGAEARMVAVNYEENGQLRSVSVRILGRPEGALPSNWKELEKAIKHMLEGSAASIVSLKELKSKQTKKRLARLRWSARVPAAMVVFAAIFALADYVCRLLHGNDLGTRAIWWLIATSVAGPALWAWVTYERQPDDRERN